MTPYTSVLFWRKIFAIFSRVLFISIVSPVRIYGSPLPKLLHRSLSLGNIDPSSDAWADTIAGIGPLILLVGEQSTKQLLCTVRGVTNAFSLAAAPLGLLTVVTSLLRLCGAERLRAFIGHNLEARTVAAVEMTRVNCGGVNAKIVDGYLIRNTNAHPSETTVAASKLEGDFSSLKSEVIGQVRQCEVYNEGKRRKGVPEDIAPVRWCMQITTSDATAEEITEMIKTLGRVNGVEIKDQGLKRFQRRFSSFYGSPLKKSDTLNSQSDEKTLNPPVDLDSRIKPNAQHAHLIGTEPQALAAPSRTTKLTYLLTFGAVSEFATAVPASGVVFFFQGLFSMMSIMAVHFIALWQLNWEPSAGWILAFFGYIGIVLGVVGGSLLIHSSCENIILNTRSSNCANWVDGVIFSATNPDSMNTSGSEFWSTLTDKRPQTFEAVWRKELSARRTQLSSTVAILLVLSYLCHYLGLRASRWWVSTGELLVCIISAFARSMSKDTQEKFSILEDVKVDKRCLSTGIINVQVSERIPPSFRMPGSVDIRAYSEQPMTQIPMDGERIAWYIASQYFRDDKLREGILKLTGLFLEVVVDGRDAEKRAVFVSFTGGILVEEGLAYPDARMGIAFCCCVSDLAAPTALLVRGIMRQPRWMIEHEELKTGTIPLGNVYIFSVNSMMNWWTLSEERNDVGDFQKQLNWPMLLVNIAFFMSILTQHGDRDPVDIISKIHAVSSLERKTAEGIAEYVKERLLD